MLRIPAIRSLPKSLFPINICAERCSTNSRLLAKNKTVTYWVEKNNSKTFASFKISSSTYVNMLNVNKIIWTNAVTITHRYLSRVAITCKNKPTSERTCCRLLRQISKCGVLDERIIFGFYFKIRLISKVNLNESHASSPIAHFLTPWRRYDLLDARFYFVAAIDFTARKTTSCKI